MPTWTTASAASESPARKARRTSSGGVRPIASSGDAAVQTDHLEAEIGERGADVGVAVLVEGRHDGDPPDPEVTERGVGRMRGSQDARTGRLGDGVGALPQEIEAAREGLGREPDDEGLRPTRHEIASGLDDVPQHVRVQVEARGLIAHTGRSEVRQLGLDRRVEERHEYADRPSRPGLVPSRGRLRSNR